MDYASLVYQRDEEVDGIGPWTWIKTDSGAWDGPKKDWEDSHKDLYFKSVKKFEIVVQAGGNQGMYPKLLARKFDLVYTFEPDPLNFYCLVQNCQEDNIIKMQAALGCVRELVSVQRNHMGNVGMHTVVPGSGGIPTIQIDDLGLPTLDLIALDTEGYERNILAGATNAIAAFEPVIICERPSQDLISCLTNFGYEIEGVSKEDTIFSIP